KKLPNPEPEIDRALRELIRMKYIIEGKLLLKEDILKNEKRRKIYEHVVKYPGAHEREIRTIFKLGAFMAFRHLGFLVKFGFLREKYYLNKKVYFPVNFEEEKEAEVLLLRNETTNKIYECLQEHGRLRLVELEEKLQIPYATVQFHIKRLVDGDLVKKIQEGSIYYYIPADIPPDENILEVRREFDYVGGKIHFKVAVRNPTNMANYRIAVGINPSEQFLIDAPQRNIANLDPNTTHELDFTLTPLTCGRSKIFGSVTFEDAFGNLQLVPIPHKEVSIKCPLVLPKDATQAEVDEWITNLKRGTSNIDFENISETEAFQIGREQVSALDLNEIIVDSEHRWGLYSGQVKVTGQTMVIKVSIGKSAIILDVWAEELKQITGILAYITNLINIALKNSYKLVQKTEDFTQKIEQLMKASVILEKTFLLCKDLGLVSEISHNLINFRQIVVELLGDQSFIQLIEDSILNLVNVLEPNSSINEQIAIELCFKLLNWFHKVHDLTQYQIRIYRETFNQVTDDIYAGFNRVKEKLVEYEKFYGLNVLSFLIILDKKSGISLFEYNLGDLRIKSDLVGGFLHVLQKFGSEISASETSMKMLTYENYQFQIEAGQYIRTALILRGSPNQFVISRLKEFVKQFEQNFEEDLLHFKGNTDVFNPANAIFEVIFERK
ncbi:MAG: winged helix-turn-helix transcriptional regulator, partial [Promethearchaeota archaeon]